MYIEVADGKGIKISREIHRMLVCEWMSLRQIVRVLGLLSVSIQAVFPAPLHYRALQRLKTKFLHGGNLLSGGTVRSGNERRTGLVVAKLQAWNGGEYLAQSRM